MGRKRVIIEGRKEGENSIMTKKCYVMIHG